ncbi:terminase small subunit [Fusobacterium ulcerans]|uniref:terminase small subunit n=1 Tax=Fusobacterium ulcerans TaxID=861 RepID=UPI0026DBCCFF|nr:terminase small subunit [Fusobacterium ulcerans]
MNNYELAEKDYQAGMKYKDIASKYNVTLNTVKSWKTRYKWKKDAEEKESAEKVCTQNKSMHTLEKGAENKISNEDKDFEYVDEEDGLTDKQRVFCHYYMQSLNAFQAAIKAEYSPSYARVDVYRLLENPSIKKYLEKLKEQQRQKFLISQERILNRHVQVALSDITDYFNEDGSLKPLSEVDGSLVRKIKITKKDDYESAEIQLIEKCPSLAWLTKFAGLDPDTNIAKERLEIEKEKVYGTGNGEGKTSGSVEKAKSILIKLRGSNESDR